MRGQATNNHDASSSDAAGIEDAIALGLSDELRAGVESIWETVVTHPFVTEVADGSLDRERLYVYVDQDYLFLRD